MYLVEAPADARRDYPRGVWHFYRIARKGLWPAELREKLGPHPLKLKGSRSRPIKKAHDESAAERPNRPIARFENLTIKDWETNRSWHRGWGEIDQEVFRLIARAQKRKNTLSKLHVLRDPD